MPKVLKISVPEKCSGCELCVFEIQRQLKKVGLEGSPIRVFRNKEDQAFLENIKFEIHLDNKVNDLNIKRILEICPNKVFEIIEVDKKEDVLLE